MPAIKYVGPFDEVEIPGVGAVSNGDTFEADGDLAKSLLTQADNFESVKATKTTSKES